MIRRPGPPGVTLLQQDLLDVSLTGRLGGGSLMLWASGFHSVLLFLFPGDL